MNVEFVGVFEVSKQDKISPFLPRLGQILFYRNSERCKNMAQKLGGKKFLYYSFIFISEFIFILKLSTEHALGKVLFISKSCDK